MALTKRVEVLFDPNEYAALDLIARQRDESVGSLLRKAARDKYLDKERQRRKEAIERLLSEQFDFGDWGDIKEELEEEHPIEEVTFDIYARWVLRIFQKKDHILEVTQKIVSLCDKVTEDVVAHRPTGEGITAINQELLDLLACLSELKPHSKNGAGVFADTAEAAQYFSLLTGGGEWVGWSWQLRKAELMAVCQMANYIDVEPNRRTFRSALGISVGKADFAQLVASVSEKRSNW